MLSLKRSAKAAASAVTGAALLAGAWMLHSEHADVAKLRVAAARPAAVDAAGVNQATLLLQTALVARQKVVVPQAAVQGRAATAAQLSQLSSTAPTTLAGLFSGSALAAEQKNLQNALTAEQDGTFQVLDGGSDGFTFEPPTSSVTTSEQRVVIQGTYRAWSKVAQLQSGGKAVPATPSNQIDFTATLINEAQAPGWHVDTFFWQFHPGSEP